MSESQPPRRSLAQIVPAAPMSTLFLAINVAVANGSTSPMSDFGKYVYPASANSPLESTINTRYRVGVVGRVEVGRNRRPRDVG